MRCSLYYVRHDPSLKNLSSGLKGHHFGGSAYKAVRTTIAVCWEAMKRLLTIRAMMLLVAAYRSGQCRSRRSRDARLIRIHGAHAPTPSSQYQPISLGGEEGPEHIADGGGRRPLRVVLAVASCG